MERVRVRYCQPEGRADAMPCVREGAARQGCIGQAVVVAPETREPRRAPRLSENAEPHDAPIAAGQLIVRARALRLGKGRRDWEIGIQVLRLVSIPPGRVGEEADATAEVVTVYERRRWRPHYPRDKMLHKAVAAARRMAKAAACPKEHPTYEQCQEEVTS